ncbi:MAG TPA: isochorismatase family protein [Blastocatellia bacterium]
MGEISRLSREQAALAVIDMQEAFRPVIPDFGQVAVQIGKAIQGAQLLEIPIIVTEQYPRGLRHTASEALRHLSENDRVIEKICFSAYQAEGFRSTLIAKNIKQVIICGIEAHICVSQTVLDLLSGGFEVYMLVDCITSRHPQSKEVALSRLSKAGAIQSNLEMALFEMMGTAESPQFKAVQSLIK